MKTILSTLAIALLLISCTKEKQNDCDIPPPRNILKEGSWSLVSVYGGFSPTLTFAPNEIIYKFDQNLTVINNNPNSNTQGDGLDSGFYSYNVISNTCSSFEFQNLSISNFINNLCVKIDGGNMTIDTGLDVDGKAYKFIRNGNSNQQCLTQVHTSVDAINAPTTGIVNQNVVVPITFTVGNGCGGLGYISETNVGNVKILKLFAKYEGCICTQALVSIATSYNFTPTSAGTQIIKIEQTDGSFLTSTITIQ